MDGAYVNAGPTTFVLVGLLGLEFQGNGIFLFNLFLLVSRFSIDDLPPAPTRRYRFKLYWNGCLLTTMHNSSCH